MTRKRFLAIAVLLAILACGTGLLAARGNDERPGPKQLYVAPWGSDAWPGTIALPLATPAGAQRAVRERTAEMVADIVVNFRGGTYALTAPLRLSATAGDAGTGGHTVVYQAYGYGSRRQERPTISGGRAVTGWRLAERVAGAWRADVGDLETRQLFVDGRRAQRAALGRRLPGKPIAIPTGYAVHNTAPQSWRNPEDVELVFNGGEGGLPYSEARCGVAGIRGDAEWTIVTVDEPCFSDLKEAYDSEVSGATPAAPTDVENSLSFLRKPGSWYLDRSRPGRHVLYYLPRPGEDPRSSRIVAPVLERLVVGEGTTGSRLHDIAFRGLTFSHATWLAPDRRTGFPQIIGSWYHSGGKARRMPGHVSFRAAERISVEGNRFTHLGGQALVLAQAGSDNTVRGNVIEDVSGGGLELRGPGLDNRVVDNWVHQIGVDYRSSVAISVEGSPNATVAHNQVNDVPYTGIWGESPRGLEVANNLVFDAVSKVPDGGGIYLPSTQGTSFANGAVVRENVVRDSGGVGIYTDVGADWVTLERNVIHGMDSAVSGVQPRRIQLIDNYWDDDEPYWWPEDTPTEGVRLAGNTLLQWADPLAACRAETDCARILAGAGLRDGAPSGAVRNSNPHRGRRY